MILAFDTDPNYYGTPHDFSWWFWFGVVLLFIWLCLRTKNCANK